MSAFLQGATITDRCELLDWDSQFFGRRIARLRADRLDDSEADAVLGWCEEHSVDCLYFLTSGAHRETLAAIEKRSFELVDVRVDLEHPLARIEVRDHETTGVRLAETTDQEALTSVAREAFTASRFFFDGRLPRDRCAALFEAWVLRDLRGERGEEVLVAEVDGATAGFVTCELDSDRTGRIGLLGVAHDARGHGIGSRLCTGALAWFVGRSARRAVVTTQARSVAALRLYERCGFTTSSVRLWYHRWFDQQTR